MAKSKSQKKLAHKLKNGVNLDPRNQRGDFGSLTGITKSTPTLVTKQRRQENKHKKRDKYDRDYIGHTYF
ncbi:gp498 [Bacillus phage G]|uniref:Gp498 n=1 Tax=Bacillus phage G TaxID=2884420 RepID=G3MAN9_9CAUD|nr:gp498 [Bacillus phage G]AEO93756.1 gp498 [Bacillus phage G]